MGREKVMVRNLSVQDEGVCYDQLSREYRMLSFGIASFLQCEEGTSIH